MLTKHSVAPCCGLRSVEGGGFLLVKAGSDGYGKGRRWRMVCHRRKFPMELLQLSVTVAWVVWNMYDCDIHSAA